MTFGRHWRGHPAKAVALILTKLGTSGLEGENKENRRTNRLPRAQLVIFFVVAIERMLVSGRGNSESEKE